MNFLDDLLFVPSTPSVDAANEAVTDGVWVQLAPYGDFPNRVGLQHFTETEAREIVNEFQSALNAPVRALGLPWYIGHPDHEPLKQRYKDTRAYGRVKELQARNDGLYGRVKFSTAGRQIITDEMFHGHSVNWAMRKAGNRFHPFRLKSVGWTNEPQIPVAPVTAANETTDNMDRTKLIQLLGLAADATDEQVEQAIGSLKTTQAANEQTIAGLRTQVTTVTSERDGEKAKLTQAQTDAANERAAHADQLIADGVRAGKILPAEKDAWKTKFAGNFIEAANELQNAKPKLNTKSKVEGLGRKSNAGGERAMQIAEAVNERMKTKGGDYNTNYAALKKEKPELFTETVS